MEYKVLRDWEMWSNRFNSESEAEEHIEKCYEEWYEWDYKVEEMTDNDMKKYI
jgi:hypothetical protein